jgi:hypothetical protein
LTDALDEQGSELGGSYCVAESVQANNLLLQQLLSQVSDLRLLLDSGEFSAKRVDAASDVDTNDADASEHPVACEAERIRLRNELHQLESEVGDLRQQNRELAAKLADKSVRKAITNTGAAQAMSWEQRKQLIIRQLEEESFDAESFVANMPYQSEDERETPELFLQRLIRELETRNQEVQDLRHLLDQQSETRQGQIAIGAAAIAELVDSDELVQQERERLQRLQSDWEEKFRDGEIAASLERAKLSRERQDLARRQAEVDEELAHLRREMRQEGETKPTASRRWLVKLGLSDQS